MKISQQQILAFNAACKHQSFSKAAVALGVTQSSVTQNVAKLESTVGAYLLERRRTGLVLTPAGRRVHMVTDDIGLLHRQLEQTIEGLAKLDRGQLRVVGTACHPAMKYMKRFRERYPGVGMSFENASWRQCELILRNREADVVMMPEPEDLQRFYTWPLGERSHAALVHEGHPFFDRDSVTIAEMAEHEVIFASAQSFSRWRLERKAAELGIVFDSVLIVNSTAMAIEAVQSGLGLTVTSSAATTLAGKVRSIPVAELARPYALVAACNIDTRDTNVVRRFFDCFD